MSIDKKIKQILRHLALAKDDDDAISNLCHKANLQRASALAKVDGCDGLTLENAMSVHRSLGLYMQFAKEARELNRFKVDRLAASVFLLLDLLLEKPVSACETCEKPKEGA